MPVCRAIIMIITTFGINMSFFFFQKSGNDMNTGIITALFSSSVVFTAVYFYFVFNQKITKWQGLGMIMIMMSVIIISFGK
jgi:multidrug transporter EmrE-like cation transporter